MQIRTATSADVHTIGAIADATELFPSEMLSELFDREPDEQIWLVCETEGAVIGFCYAVPEQLTEGTWNMLAIGVEPGRQGHGAGGLLGERLESDLKARGVRLLLADTSGTAAFGRTRSFYAKHGYEEEARIRDFWAEGDDKVTFRKAL